MSANVTGGKVVGTKNSFTICLNLCLNSESTFELNYEQDFDASIHRGIGETTEKSVCVPCGEYETPIRARLNEKLNVIEKIIRKCNNKHFY